MIPFFKGLFTIWMPTVKSNKRTPVVNVHRASNGKVTKLVTSKRNKLTLLTF